MTYWRMTGGVKKHPIIEPGEVVHHASYGLSAGVVKAANHAVDPTPESTPSPMIWNSEMGEAIGMAAPLGTTGVLALTDRRLLFFKKMFAIGAVKTLAAQWPIKDVTAVQYDKESNTLTVGFSDGTSAGLHCPKSQHPHKIVEGFVQKTSP